MASQETSAPSLNWSGKLRTKGGAIAILQPSDGVTTKRRVLMCRDGSYPPSDPKEQMRPGKQVTVWLYPEDGIARCDRNPSDADLVNVAA